MEWVETTGRTVEEAKELALDRLGVHEEDAEFEVVDEPRPGLFGRMRGEARVRARVRPTRPRPKAERRGRRKPRADDAATADADAAASPDETPSEAEDATDAPDDGPVPAKKAAKRAPAPAATGNGDLGSDDEAGREAERAAGVSFLEGLLDALGEQGTVEVVVQEPDEAELRVTGDELGVLIGPRGQTLIAVQDLTRLAAQRRVGDRHGRIRVDIGGYRERRREALSRFTAQVATEVVASGESRALEPMSSMDRKVVHDAANELDGVETVSEGEEPFRRVIIRPSARA